MKKLIFTIFVLFLLGLLALSVKTYLDSDMNTYNKNDKVEEKDKDKNDKDKNDKDEKNKDEKDKDKDEVELEIDPLKKCNLEDYEGLTKEDKIEETKPFVYEIETIEGFNVPYINIDEASIVEANKEFSKLANYIKANPGSMTTKGIEYKVDYIINKDKNILSIVIDFTDNAFIYKEALNINLKDKCVYTFANALADNAITYNIVKDRISKHYKEFTFGVETEDQLYDKVVNNIDTLSLGLSNQYADKIANNVAFYVTSSGKINLAINYKIMEAPGHLLHEITLN